MPDILINKRLFFYLKYSFKNYLVFNINIREYLTNVVLKFNYYRITLPTKIFAMKRNILFTLLFIASLTVVNSQAQSVFKDTDIDKYISTVPIPKNNEINLVGTPYASEDFLKGIAVKDGLTIARNIGLRYNANKDVFEIKKTFVLTDDQARLLKKTDEISLKINNDSFVFLVPNAVNKAHGYFVTLYKGEQLILYKKIKKEYIPGQKAYSSMTRPVPPTYKEKLTYYIADNEGILTELSSSKKKRTEALNDDYKKEIPE